MRYILAIDQVADSCVLYDQQASSVATASRIWGVGIFNHWFLTDLETEQRRVALSNAARSLFLLIAVALKPWGGGELAVVDGAVKIISFYEV